MTTEKMKWNFCPICGTEWTQDCEQFECWQCGTINSTSSDESKEVSKKILNQKLEK